MIFWLHWHSNQARERNGQLLLSVAAISIVAVAKANEIGVCAPFGFFDPLGFAPKNKRTDISEVVHSKSEVGSLLPS